MLNDITETRAFDKVKKGDRAKEYLGKRSAGCNTPKMAMQVLKGEAMHQDNAQLMGKCVQHAARWGTSGRCAGAKETVGSMKWK